MAKVIIDKWRYEWDTTEQFIQCVMLAKEVAKAYDRKCKSETMRK